MVAWQDSPSTSTPLSAAALNAAFAAKADASMVSATYVPLTDTRLTDARVPLAHTHPSSAITDFTTAVDARIAASGRTYGTIAYGASYAADPTAGALKLYKIGSTVYMEGAVKNIAVISTVATGQYVLGTVPTGFIPLTGQSQWRGCAVGQDAVGFGFGTWRVDPSTGAITWQDYAARTSIPIGALHVAVTLMTWEV